MEEVVVVTGFAAHRIEERKADLEAAHDVRLELVFNDKALEWNNAYSLWCARDHFDQGVLLCNGDTVHPGVGRGERARPRAATTTSSSPSTTSRRSARRR